MTFFEEKIAQQIIHIRACTLSSGFEKKSLAGKSTVIIFEKKQKKVVISIYFLAELLYRLSFFLK